MNTETSGCPLLESYPMETLPATGSMQVVRMLNAIPLRVAKPLTLIQITINNGTEIFTEWTPMQPFKRMK